MNLFYFIGIAIISAVDGQINRFSASTALNGFALRLLVQISENLPSDKNVAVSPYTIWTAMSVINEGARGNTARQLERTLGIPSNKDAREWFKRMQYDIVRNVTQKQEGVTLEVLNSVFIKLTAQLQSNFKELVRTIYNVEVESLNFDDVPGTTRYINNKLSNATRGQISTAVNEDAVRNSDMFVTSALFFKGLWDKKFDIDATRDQPFFDENGKTTSTVSMMHNSGNFPFSYILNNKATAVEMPYLGDRMSMIAILPTKGVTLSAALRLLAQTPIDAVLRDLQTARETYQESEIVIRLPRFNVSTNLNLNDVLQEMGIQDAFDMATADLTGISKPRGLYLSKVTHKSRIEVDENGTVGSAVTVVEIVDRITAPYFTANRPFAFFVVDKLTHSIIFMGRINNPQQTD